MNRRRFLAALLGLLGVRPARGATSEAFQPASLTLTAEAMGRMFARVTVAARCEVAGRWRGEATFYGFGWRGLWDFAVWRRYTVTTPGGRRLLVRPVGWVPDKGGADAFRVEFEEVP